MNKLTAKLKIETNVEEFPTKPEDLTQVVFGGTHKISFVLRKNRDFINSDFVKSIL